MQSRNESKLSRKEAGERKTGAPDFKRLAHTPEPTDPPKGASGKGVSGRRRAKVGSTPPRAYPPLAHPPTYATLVTRWLDRVALCAAVCGNSVRLRATHSPKGECPHAGKLRNGVHVQNKNGC